MPINYDGLFREAGEPQEPAAAEPQGQLSKEEFAAKNQAERESLPGLSNKAQTAVTANGDVFEPFLNTLFDGSNECQRKDGTAGLSGTSKKCSIFRRRRETKRPNRGVKPAFCSKP
jgi:hypothetical protein